MKIRLILLAMLVFSGCATAQGNRELADMFNSFDRTYRSTQGSEPIRTSCRPAAFGGYDCETE